MRRGDLSPDGCQFWDSDAWGWQDLWLSAAAALTAACDEFGVEVRSADLLSEGYLNQSWRLHCVDHDRVLRVSRSERTVAQVRYEYDLTSSWAEEIPQVIAAESRSNPLVSGHVLTLFPYCEGVPGTAVNSGTRSHQIADVMARMHRISLRLGLQQREGYAAIDEQPASEYWCRHRNAIVDRFGTGSEVRRLVTTVDRATAELDRLIIGWRESGRLGLRAAVHGDLNARNQIYRDQRLVGVIDADECRSEPMIVEVAGLAYTDPAARPDEVWQSYLDAGGPLDPQDDELLLTFARRAALTELQWSLDDSGVATHLALDHLRGVAESLSGTPVRG
jgi:Ser/Thr protein kinase RdoA (MazF antagonist)